MRLEGNGFLQQDTSNLNPFTRQLQFKVGNMINFFWLRPWYLMGIGSITFQLANVHEGGSTSRCSLMQ